MTEAALAYAQQHQQRLLDTLYELLRIPSISTLPEHAGDLDRAARWLAAHMQAIGLSRVELLPTAGAEVVYGEWLGAGPDAPTLLAYGHYDVQPVDPAAMWHTPPFEPTLVGDWLHCRGVSDDKGQVFLVLAAVEAYLRANGSLPVNFKIMIEGEEETSSPHMAAFVAAQRQRLAADAVIICDGGMLGMDQPLIEYGVRGNCYLELQVTGPARDLHSGTFGGVVDNPFNVLVRILAQMQDGHTHRVLIPGFYDRVRGLSDDDRVRLAQANMDEAHVKRLAGVPATAGEEGFTPAECVGVRPTFDIHGMPGGFTGAGKKTVIPAQAAAKVSMRLAPDQDPEEIADLFEAHARRLAPPTVQVAVQRLGLSRPAVMDCWHPAVVAADEAYYRGFGVRPVYLRGGGSLPIVADFQDELGAAVVLMGLGLPEDNIHAPNERYYLPNFGRGLATLIYFFDLLAPAG